MTLLRAALCLSLLAALAACDSDKPEAPSEKPPAVVPQAPAPSEPPAAVAPAEPAPAAPASEARPAPEERAEPAAPAPVPKAPAQLRPSVPSRPAPHEAAPSEPVAPLDLSLPSDLLERLPEPGEASAQPLEQQTLLPPLFGEKKDGPQSFELGGRLITNEGAQTGEDTWHSVEGAELQLQFRR